MNQQPFFLGEKNGILTFLTSTGRTLEATSYEQATYLDGVVEVREEPGGLAVENPQYTEAKNEIESLKGQISDLEWEVSSLQDTVEEWEDAHSDFIYEKRHFQTVLWSATTNLKSLLEIVEIPEGRASATAEALKKALDDLDSGVDFRRP